MQSTIRRVVRASTLAGLAAFGVMRAQAPGARAEDDSSESRIRQGFAIAPVPLAAGRRNGALVGLGSYIVNATGCVDCHTSPPFALGGNPYLGEPKKINAAAYLGGGAAYGPFISRNLTPDKSGRPAGSTLEEFVATMRTGIDRKHAHPQFGPFIQVMPWPFYQSMTDQDLRAIYEYLSAIPCVDGEPGIPGAPLTGRCN